MPHYSDLCEVLAIRNSIITLRELDTRRELTANHDAVRLTSLTSNRLFAAELPTLDADIRAPFPRPDAGHRAPSPTQSLTPPHSPTASQTAENDAPLASPRAVTSQNPPALNAHFDADARPQRRRNRLLYLDDYVVSPFQRAYNVECAKHFESQSHVSDDSQFMRLNSSHLLLDVHSSPHSNHYVSQQPSTNANDDITIGFIYSSDDPVPSAVPSYSYCVSSSVENYVKSQLCSRRRDRTSHRIARRRHRPHRQH